VCNHGIPHQKLTHQNQGEGHVAPADPIENACLHNSIHAKHLNVHYIMNYERSGSKKQSIWLSRMSQMAHLKLDKDWRQMPEKAG